MKEITFKAVLENLQPAMSFVTEALEEMGCGMKVVMAMELATDELFSNIAFYAYKGQPEPGDAVLRLEKVDTAEGSEIHLTFSDRGIPYNPLNKQDPDVEAPLEERDIGGLGIFLVKKSMDDVQYEYADGQNRLTIVKKI